MCVKKTVFGFCLLLFVSVNVNICLAGGGGTVAEAADQQAELQRVQMEQAIRDAQKGGPGQKNAVPLPAERHTDNLVAADSDILLTAVYGMDNSLTADIILNGTVFPVRKNDSLGNWIVKKINASSVELINGKKIKTLYLSVRPEQGGETVSSGAVAIPPLPPM